MSSIHVEYEPPWLVRLRELDPAAAAAFDEDPAKTSKLDTALAGVADADTKIAIIRTCLNAGVDVNDPAINLMIIALGIQKLVSQDTSDTLHAARAAAASISSAADDLNHSIDDAVAQAKGQTKENIEEIRRASKAAIKGLTTSGDLIARGLTQQYESLSNLLADVRTTLGELPEAAGQIRNEIAKHARTTAKEAVNEHATSFANTKFEVAIREHVDHFKGLLETIGSDLNAMRGATEPIRRTIKLIEGDQKIFLTGFRLTRHAWCAALLGKAIGFVLGMAVMAWLVATFQVGLGPQLLADARAGRFYSVAYTLLSPECRVEMKTLADGKPR